jgi:hypothetical protein
MWPGGGGNEQESEAGSGSGSSLTDFAVVCSPLPEMPFAVFREVFACLPLRDQLLGACVSQSWRRLVVSGVCWRELAFDSLCLVLGRTQIQAFTHLAPRLPHVWRLDLSRCAKLDADGVHRLLRCLAWQPYEAAAAGPAPSALFDPELCDAGAVTAGSSSEGGGLWAGSEVPKGGDKNQTQGRAPSFAGKKKDELAASLAAAEVGGPHAHKTASLSRPLSAAGGRHQPPQAAGPVNWFAPLPAGLLTGGSSSASTPAALPTVGPASPASRALAGSHANAVALRGGSAGSERAAGGALPVAGSPRAGPGVALQACGLTWLSLQRTTCGDGALALVAQCCPRLQKLDLSHCEWVGDAALADLARG